MQMLILQVELHVEVLGGSHSSPVSTTPLPQTGAAMIRWQVALQVEVLGGSHCSLAWLTVPSPQYGMFWQVLEQ